MKNITPKYNKTTKKKFILLLGVILLLIVAAGAYYLIQKNGSDNSPIESMNNNSSDEAVKDTDGKEAEEPATLPDNSQGLTTDEVPVSESAVAQITRLEQIDSTVYFSAKISNTSNLGRCVVSFVTPNDRPVTKEFNSVKNGDDYVCAINVSALEFSYLGKWDVTLRYYISEEQVTAMDSITIS